MALLTLQNIGKIYVSEGNIAVGIRGVNLSFDRGEFVAVTGKSGSGKSTLLNIISGMDSYEEGELYIDGAPTSHYLQPDWESYREQYISFIFQDYNIIESFTVLQNVELALMHIDDKRERRRRALELLERVGLSSHVRQKGSKLSGGQKQRTVIARALAKDSPIILADEPTGNLDHATSKEIIELLHEVSRDKLLIVVTHNFEEVAACATRHVRVFDGAVESDHVLSPAVPKKEEPKKAEPTDAPKKKLTQRRRDIRNGLTLGKTIFTSKPRLSLFLCLLLIVGAFGVFSVTSLCGEAGLLFEDYTMFRPIDGRVVFTKQNGEVITEEELAAIAAEYGAADTLHYDVLLGNSSLFFLQYEDHLGRYSGFQAQPSFGEEFGEHLGRYPEAEDEVYLHLPIGMQPDFGKDAILTETVNFNGLELRVCGVSYFYDNNLNAVALLSEEGFRTMTAVYYMNSRSQIRISVNVADPNTGRSEQMELSYFVPSFAVERDKIYIEPAVLGYKNQASLARKDVTLTLNATYNNYDYFYSSSVQSMSFYREFDNDDLTAEKGNDLSYAEVIISTSILRDMADEVLEKSYRQASLFFADNAAAADAAALMRENGYIAVTADTTYTPPVEETILALVGAIAIAFVWFLGMVFLAFFINLCSARTIGAFKGDMAIMRSMGIPVKVVRIGMYVRMLIALIPAYLFVILGAAIIYTSPTLNPTFVYLYPWQYAAIFVGVLIVTLRTTRKQIRKLFGESVKKSLRGGNAE